MAELNVQPKERTVWPWILGGVLVLALILWMMLGRGNGDLDVGASNATDTTMVGAAAESSVPRSASGAVDGGAVTQFLQFVENRTSRDANPSHEYTADGLRRLTAALTAVASRDSDGGVALQPRIDEIRDRVDGLTRDSTSTEHARQAREAFTMTAQLIEQMRVTRGANVAGAATNTADSTASQGALNQAATAIDASRPLLEQAAMVEQFFAQAAEALRVMSGTTR